MRLSARDREWLESRKYRRWWEVSRKAERRQELRRLFEFCVALAGQLIEAGIDPAERVKALERGVEAYEVLEEIGDTPELRAADEALLAQNPRPPSRRLGPARRRDRGHDRRLARQYAEGRELDLANCTLNDARIFCLARLCPEKWGLPPGVAAVPAADCSPSPSMASMGEGRGGGDARVPGKPVQPGP